MRGFLLAIAALALVSSSKADVITFDDLPGDSMLVPDGYGGVTWGGVWTYYGDIQSPYTANSDPNRVYDEVTDGEFSFSPTTFQGAYFAGVDTTTVQFDLYLAGVLVGTSSVLTTSDVPTFLSSGYSGLVDTVDVVSNAPDFFVMDDVTLDETTVPEPSALALTGVSLFFLVGLVYFRKVSPRSAQRLS